MFKVIKLVSLFVLSNMCVQSRAMILKSLMQSDKLKKIIFPHSNLAAAINIENKVEVESYKPPHEKQHKNFYELLHNQVWSTESKKYIKQFEEEYQLLMSEYYQLMGITKEEFEKEKAANYQKYLSILKNESFKELPGPMYDRINLLLDFLGFEKNKIKVLMNENIMSAESSQNSIYISIGSCSQKTSNEFDAIVLHEIMHIIHDDAFVSTLMRWLYSKRLNQDKNISKMGKVLPGLAWYIPLPGISNIGTKLPNLTWYYIPFRIKWNHCKEKRADILSALTHPEYALIQNAYYKKKIEEYGDRSFTTHPKKSTRAAYFQQLYQEMQEAIETSETQK